jgi:type IV pilus assembly protein PilB
MTSQPETRKLLGERLLEAGLIRERELEQALQAQQSTGEQLGRVLVRLGHLHDDDLLRMLCEDAGISFSLLIDVLPEPAAVAAVSESLARTNSLLPLSITGDRIVVAFADPFNIAAVSTVERATGLRVSPVGAPRGALEELIERAYRNGGDGPQVIEASAPDDPGRMTNPYVAEPPPEPPDGSSTAAQIANEIFERGVSLGATDIHIEPTEDGVQVRYRLDGILREGSSYPKALQAPLLTRIKVLSGLNIAESRLPQDGRLRARLAGRDVELRISTFPTLHGEDLVLRVLDRTRTALQLSKLGLNEEDLATLRDALKRPLGLVLITGPTGSGKTTTLYAALSELNTGERCILTLEDPIEYELAGVRQAQVNARAGLTFASGLRSMLRHDPDVILVGEIRDADTAQIALSAAMTGHVVLSTIHTNSAAAAIPRLLDMGAEPFALASSLHLSVAQRLLRVLCAECRQPTEVPAAVRRRFALGDAIVYRANGCQACSGTGYRGRIAIFEMLPLTDEVSEAIYERRNADEIQRIAKRPTLLESGLARVRQGHTTLEELLRVASI